MLERVVEARLYGRAMPGRRPKPRLPSSERSKLLERLVSDVGNYRAQSEREAMEKTLGRRLTDQEWLAIQMAEKDQPK